jgi:hypothetical protein
MLPNDLSDKPNDIAREPGDFIAPVVDARACVIGFKPRSTHRFATVGRSPEDVRDSRDTVEVLQHLFFDAHQNVNRLHDLLQR